MSCFLLFFAVLQVLTCVHGNSPDSVIFSNPPELLRTGKSLEGNQRETPEDRAYFSSDFKNWNSASMFNGVKQPTYDNVARYPSQANYYPEVYPNKPSSSYGHPPSVEYPDHDKSKFDDVKHDKDKCPAKCTDCTDECGTFRCSPNCDDCSLECGTDRCSPNCEGCEPGCGTDRCPRACNDCPSECGTDRCPPADCGCDDGCEPVFKAGRFNNIINPEDDVCCSSQAARMALVAKFDEYCSNTCAGVPLDTCYTFNSAFSSLCSCNGNFPGPDLPDTDCVEATGDVGKVKDAITDDEKLGDFLTEAEEQTLEDICTCLADNCKQRRGWKMLCKCVKSAATQ